jgi:hypothetical protein
VDTALLDELGELLDCAAAGEGDWLVLLIAREELDGREALDVIGHVVGGSIDLGDSDLVGGVFELAGQLVVFGSEGLAVSAPWGVELDEDILVVLDNVFLVRGSNDDVDWAFLGLGLWLRLDRGLELAGFKVLDELGDELLSEGLGLIEGELGVLGGVLNGEGRPLADLEVEVAAVLSEGLGVNGSEVDLALELLSDGAEFAGELLALVLSLSEDVCKW